MEEITTHYDSLGLNDLLVLTRDERDPNADNASHRYIGRTTQHLDPPQGAEYSDLLTVLDIRFQHGPRMDPESKPGCLEGAVLTILTDRAARRHAQGVLGRSIPHKS